VGAAVGPALHGECQWRRGAARAGGHARDGVIPPVCRYCHLCCRPIFSARALSQTLARGAAPGDTGSYAQLADTLLPEPGRFAEGMCLWPAAAVIGGPPAPPSSSVLVQLTWQDRVAFLYDPDTLALLGSLPFTSDSGEGWGLTHDGARMLASDGSASLQTWDFAWSPAAPGTAAFSRVRAVSVRDAARAANVTCAPPPPGVAAGAAISRLNELEYAHGWVLANVYTTNTVAIIDPASGAAVSYLDFTPLKAEQTGAAEVLNGLAYTMTLGPTSPDADGAADAAWGGRLWVTGKDWQTLYELELSGLQTPNMAALARRRRLA
jgi:glutamine cyclotransferase